MLLVFPYSPKDYDLAVKLAKWMKELGGCKGHQAMIVRDSRCEEEEVKSLLSKSFDSVVPTVVVVDQYNKWAESPNQMIQEAARYIEHTVKKHWFWIEPDCVPLKENWLNEIESGYKEAMKLGKPFMGQKIMVPNVPVHCSGVCCYPHDLCNHAGTIYQATDVAWDCHAANQIVPRMHQTSLIAHRWRYPAPENQSEVDNLLGQIGDAVLFHSDKSGRLIDFLRERRQPATIPLPTKQNDSTGILEIANDVSTALQNATGDQIKSFLSAKNPAVDIFIKTYPDDYPWLEYCLRSIRKFATGFRKVVIVSSAPLKADATVFQVKEHIEDGYLSQQIFKLNADNFSDADYILHIDSDTIFTRPVSPETYFTNGKIDWLMTPYVKTETPWKAITEKFLKQPVEFEFMRRFPIMIPRWLYAAIRGFSERTHGVSADSYVVSQPYREFSEFNALGAFAYQFHNERFNWLNTENGNWPELTVDQRWSRGGLTDEIKAEWDKILGDGHDNNKSQSYVVSPGQIESESSKPIPQKPLKGRASNRAEKNQPKESPAPLPFLLSEVAKHFTSPLAKGRIFKSLKAYPIIK